MGEEADFSRDSVPGEGPKQGRTWQAGETEARERERAQGQGGREHGGLETSLKLIQNTEMCLSNF